MRGGRGSHCSPGPPLKENAMIFKDKRILLGVSGGIAGYKAAELARRLTAAGAQVKVVMTAAAEQFVGPLTFAGLTGQPVSRSLWGDKVNPMEHIFLGQQVDAIVIAPATANFIGKVASGHGRRSPDHHYAGRHPAGAGVSGHELRDVGQPGGAGKYHQA